MSSDTWILFCFLFQFSFRLTNFHCLKWMKSKLLLRRMRQKKRGITVSKVRIVINCRQQLRKKKISIISNFNLVSWDSSSSSSSNCGSDSGCGNSSSSSSSSLLSPSSSSSSTSSFRKVLLSYELSWKLVL